MATNKKPRKPYRPKRNLVNPVAHVLDGMTVLAPKAVTTLLLANHAAMYEIVQGRGTQEHWRTVTGALNMAIALDEQVYCSTEAPTLIAALKAQARCGVRGFKGQALGYTGPDLQLINHALSVHNEQVERATIGEIERAIDACRRRERSEGEHYTVRQIAEQAEQEELT